MAKNHNKLFEVILSQGNDWHSWTFTAKSFKAGAKLLGSYGAKNFKWDEPLRQGVRAHGFTFVKDGLRFFGLAGPDGTSSK